MPSLPVSPAIFSLILNELVVALPALKSTILPSAAFITGSSLQYCYKVFDVFE